MGKYKYVDLVNTINENGYNGRELYIKSLGLAWSYWDDNDDEHNDDDALTDYFEVIKIKPYDTIDMNGMVQPIIVLVDSFGKEYDINNLPYEDADECRQYIIDEIVSYC